ncbi:SdpI family protein [Corynebacterium heidelbergense]|uniref:SdpI family protein n=1 Tax=Corynebacterium heidelbergense TaxID=2055947 RepID=A0A364V7M0_9CORY|nr:SdpI family protein [Corynebacterium heidelbergense]RAV32608.1 hypothetical protein DLJ54_02570 [Corynebacterium heidelbergense]
MFCILSATYTLAGAMFLWLALASRRGLSRNHCAGIRTPKTMRSDEAFVTANRAVWGLTFLQGAIFLLSAVALILVSRAQVSPAASLGFALLPAVISLGLVVPQVRRAHRAVDLLPGR